MICSYSKYYSKSSLRISLDDIMLTLLQVSVNWVAIITPTCSSLAILTFFILLIVFIKRNSARKWFFYHRFPLHTKPISSKDIRNKKMWNIISEQLDRSVNCTIEPPGKVKSEFKHYRVGWGKTTGIDYPIHYKEFIAKSHLLLEKAAVYRDQSLSREKYQSIRDYVMMLMERCGSDDEKWFEYLSFYEKARFGEEEIRKREFSAFLEILLDILQYLGKQKV